MKGATSIQERLWELRKDKGLNLEELSKLTGISKSALGSYEKEDFKEINHGNLITLADFYGVSVDYLLLNIYNYFRIEMNSGTILGYFLQALPIACIVGIAFFAIRFAFLKKRKLQIKWKLEILQVIFACYLAGLISLVVLPANFWLGFYDGIFFGWWSEMGQVFQLGVVNLVPSVIICLTGELSLGSWGKTMLIGNIAMFVPFGFFLPLITELKSRKRIVLAAIIVPICFEVAQLFFGRSFDVDDLICNFIGIIISAMVAYLILKTNSTDVPKGR